ncbi:hypothetical protein K503DRAFT_867423 [Rhizopogon vinicolor AM-OR11-026]|uniref:BED-type domain-containing protein n=1 Tax=Rhizopogon vinicolor AM-OR11-026 TaxID=1314800 RepID=A0A1B7MVK8_9AGAM|nr:hypothetical protein K503DRAFT_867423 [Rhizopogon vinicolor AM-OR11-026]
MSLPRPKGCPTREIITDHFVQAEKVQNSSNRHFFKCNYCSKSIEGRDDKPLKHILNWNACPTAPDHARTEVRNYLATKNGNQDLILPPIVDVNSTSSPEPTSGGATQDHTPVLSHKQKNLWVLVGYTQPEHGLDTALADQLQRSFAWVPPLASNSRTDSDDEFLVGPESITGEELLEEFDRFEHEMRESRALQEGSNLFTDKVPDVFTGGTIDLNELEKVDRGIAPTGFIEEIDVVSRGSQGMEAGWNINALLTSEGVTSM